MTAVYNGVGPEYRTAGADEAMTARQALGLPDDYLLLVGTVEPRKNVATLLRAFCDLPAELRRRCPLVLAGGWGWKSAEVADYYRQDAAGRGVGPRRAREGDSRRLRGEHQHFPMLTGARMRAG